MKAAIVIDKWKLPIFTKHLREAGFSYEEKGGTGTELVLTVETDSGQRLAQVMLKANRACAEAGRKQ